MYRLPYVSINFCLSLIIVLQFFMNFSPCPSFSAGKENIKCIRTYNYREGKIIVRGEVKAACRLLSVFVVSFLLVCRV